MMRKATPPVDRSVNSLIGGRLNFLPFAVVPEQPQSSEDA